MDIHWFPGHMKKAINEIEAKIKIVDVVIELFDSRIPLSSINEDFEKIIANKKKLYIFSKKDLADDKSVEKWVNYYKGLSIDFLFCNLKDKGIDKSIKNLLNKLGSEKRKKEIAKGLKPQPIKVMIIGIPNVGKSSLINLLAKRSAAGVQNKPGYTRGEQYIKIDKDFLLMDTPGILPTSYDNKEKAAKLALIGSVREDILPNEYLLNYLLNYFKNYYPNALEVRYGIKEIIDMEQVINDVASKRHLLSNNGEIDRDRTVSLILKEFKLGLLGKLSLE